MMASAPGSTAALQERPDTASTACHMPTKRKHEDLSDEGATTEDDLRSQAPNVEMTPRPMADGFVTFSVGPNKEKYILRRNVLTGLSPQLDVILTSGSEAASGMIDWLDTPSKAFNIFRIYAETMCSRRGHTAVQSMQEPSIKDPISLLINALSRESTFFKCKSCGNPVGHISTGLFPLCLLCAKLRANHRWIIECVVPGCARHGTQCKGILCDRHFEEFEEPDDLDLEPPASCRSNFDFDFNVPQHADELLKAYSELIGYSIPLDDIAEIADCIILADRRGVDGFYVLAMVTLYSKLAKIRLPDASFLSDVLTITTRLYTETARVHSRTMNTSQKLLCAYLFFNHNEVRRSGLFEEILKLPELAKDMWSMMSKLIEESDIPIDIY